MYFCQTKKVEKSIMAPSVTSSKLHNKQKQISNLRDEKF